MSSPLVSSYKVNTELFWPLLETYGHKKQDWTGISWEKVNSPAPPLWPRNDTCSQTRAVTSAEEWPKTHKPYRCYIYTCTHTLGTTKPQAFTCLRSDFSFWLFSCSRMGGVCLLYLGCWRFFPSSLPWECLGLVVTGERVCPHTHTVQKVSFILWTAP